MAEKQLKRYHLLLDEEERELLEWAREKLGMKDIANVLRFFARGGLEQLEAELSETAFREKKEGRPKPGRQPALNQLAAHSTGASIALLAPAL